jgi:hypothetical protein
MADRGNKKSSRVLVTWSALGYRLVQYPLAYTVQENIEGKWIDAENVAYTDHPLNRVESGGLGVDTLSDAIEKFKVWVHAKQAGGAK